MVFAMNRKRWCQLSLLLLLAAFLFLFLLVTFIDPFQVYRLAEHYIPPIDNTTQVYANAGIVRNYDYDSAIVGSSVTENFRPTFMDTQLGGRFIKLCTAAGTASNHAMLMNLAFRTHSMRRIVYGFDIYSYISDAGYSSRSIPDYLYDNNPFNDVRYWYNRTVIASFLPRCLSTWGQQQDNSIRDSMYCWAGKDEYGAIAMYNAQLTPPDHILPEDYYLENARANLETNLIAFIASHPETQFDIFFPPYSAAEWSSMLSKGTLYALLAIRSLAYDMLTPYENVTLYDFSIRDDWVLHISNYKDTTHYGQWINDAITESIAKGENVPASLEEILRDNAQLTAWAESILEKGGWCFE